MKRFLLLLPLTLSGCTLNVELKRQPRAAVEVSRITREAPPSPAPAKAGALHGPLKYDGRSGGVILGQAKPGQVLRPTARLPDGGYRLEWKDQPRRKLPRPNIP